MNHPKDDIPILSFNTAKAWEAWLKKNGATAQALWLRFYKKGSQVQSINYSEALDVALCYGWIDGLVNKFDEVSYLQRFTPRRPRSIWSKKNIEHVERLIREGKMNPAGLQQIEAAKADGRWAAAYDSSANMVIPADFLQALSRNPKAQKFFKTLNKTNVYAIAWRLQTAKKPETRERRMKQILEMLEKGEKLH